jgi:hypothetical protein
MGLEKSVNATTGHAQPVAQGLIPAGSDRLQRSIFEQALAMQDVLIPDLIRMRNLFFSQQT